MPDGVAGRQGRGRLLSPPRRLVIALLAASLAAGCVQNDGSRNPLKGMFSVGVDDERAVGFEADQEIQAGLRGAGKLIEDPLVLAFLHELGQSMVSSLGDQPFTYRFRVVADPSLNAFALPGGPIYFNSGTLLQATSLDELAGVMAHEIAHVKGRHYARMRERAAIPSLLAQVAAVAAAAATGQAEPLIIAQGVNVALQLSYTREFEAEADTLATAFLARSGYPPDGVVPFFERILASQRHPGIDIPPYLYSHPAVESRIATARERAKGVTVTGTVPPGLRRAFRAAQYRLALLQETNRTELRMATGGPDRRADPILAHSRVLADSGDVRGALAELAAAEEVMPAEPRLAYRRGELLEEAGRLREAADAFQKAAVLDPNVALNFYRLGQVKRRLGQRIQAVFFLEQAARGFEREGTLRKKTDEALRRLIFPVLDKAGVADGATRAGADTPAGHSQERFLPSDAQVVWWGWVTPPYIDRRPDVRVRFYDPSGALVQDGPAQRLKRPSIGATLPLSPEIRDRHGIWRIIATLDDDPIHQTTFRLEPTNEK